MALGEGNQSEETTACAVPTSILKRVTWKGTQVLVRAGAKEIHNKQRGGSLKDDGQILDLDCNTGLDRATELSALDTSAL